MPRPREQAMNLMRCMIEQDEDSVVMHFSARGNVLPLSGEQCEIVCEALRKVAAVAKAHVEAGGKRKLVLDRDPGLSIGSRDGTVYLHFDRPTDREVMPWEGAMRLADAIQNECQQTLSKLSRDIAAARGDK